MSDKKRYRLPGTLGGGEFEASYQFTTAPGYAVSARHAYEGFLPEVGGVILRFNERLEEILPPSIDDPVPWPLEIEDDLSDACLYLHDPEPVDLARPFAELRLRVREEHLTDRRHHVTASLRLDAAGLLRLAQAAYQRWQRATAIEGATDVAS